MELVYLGGGGLEIDARGFEEDGKTFEENAEKKALFFGSRARVLTLAEDSGIVVEALKDELGVKTRRWGAGEFASDEEWLNFFMKRMESEENRAAEFVCCACLYDPRSGEKKFFRGETKGVISREILAPILKGLPLSSVFVPEGMAKSYAELGAREKNKISHRGKAISQVRDFLEESGVAA